MFAIMRTGTAGNIAAVIVIVAVCHLAYWSSLSGPFQFDDHWQIVGNRDIRNALDPVNIWDFNPRRFVLMYTFALNFAIGGMNAWNYHYTNLLIHAGNAILIFFLGKMILGRLLRRTEAESEASDPDGKMTVNLAAFFAALFFVVHPLLTEGVTYISGRSSSLCALFGLLAVLLYLRGRTAKGKWSAVAYIAFAFLFCIFAMFTKELGAVIPLIIILVEYFCFWRGRALSLRALCAAPFAAMLALAVAYVAYCLLRYGMLTKDEGHLSIAYLLTQFKVWLLYLAALVFPTRLNIDHRIPLAQGLNADVLISMLFILAILAAAIILTRRKGIAGLVSFAVFWMAVSLLPTSSIFYLRDAMAERHMYFPSIGLFLLGGYAVSVVLNTARSLTGKKRLVPYLPVLALLGVFGFMTYERNTFYSDHLKLWLDVRNQEPDSYRAAYSCGLGWMEHALWRRQEGRTDLRTALLWNACNSLVEANQLGPDEYDPYLALSDVETVQEDFQSAVGYAMQGVYLAEKGKGGTVEVYSRLVRVYFFAGAVNFKNGEAIKDEADKLKEHGGGKEAVGALLQESEEEYENSRRNLLRSIDSYDRTLGLSPHEYEKDDEFVIATEYYYAAHKLLGFYYLDRNQLQLAQMYFEKWAGHMFAHPTKEDIDVAEQFFAVWRDKTIKGTMKQQTQQGQP